MIAEAFDTLFTLGWAFLIWMVLVALAASTVLYAVIVTVAFACRTAWRGVTAALALVQRSRAPELLPEPHKPAPAHAVPSRPSWARTQPIKES